MNRLPLFISIPHGGIEAPIELLDRIRIERVSGLEDGDAFTRDIYGVAEHVKDFLQADIARAFVDVNRAEDDRPPANSDGVVKSHTRYGKPIYLEGHQPDGALTEELLEKYHRPYHRKIQEAMSLGNDFILAVDCHSMSAVAPKVAPDSGRRRPIFCLGNCHNVACPKNMLTLFSECLQRTFDLRQDDIMENNPFAGGYITRTHGAHPTPWIQVKMSRDLFLRAPYFDASTWTMDRDRLLDLRGNFLAALELFCKRYPLLDQRRG